MDFQLTEEQRIFKKMVHDFADQRMAPLVKAWDEECAFMDRKILSQYVEMGLLGISLPEKYGGAGLSAFEAILAIEELARISPIAASPVFETSVGPIRVVDIFGTEEQKQRFLPPSCMGEKLMAVAMTEPGAGSALTDLTTRAVLKGDHYVLNGQKRFISGGGHSDSYMV